MRLYAGFILRLIILVGLILRLGVDFNNNASQTGSAEHKNTKSVNVQHVIQYSIILDARATLKQNRLVTLLDMFDILLPLKLAMSAYTGSSSIVSAGLS